MAKKKKQARRRIPSKQPGRSAGLVQRRVPQPKLSAAARERLARNYQYAPPQTEHPMVRQIVALITKVATASRLPVHVIVSDWVKMIEGGLCAWADNMRAMAIEGKFVEDTPEYKEIFRAARERYQAATRKYPSVYRQMEEAFARSMALLMEGAQSLEEYRTQTGYHPDLIGQVWLAFHHSRQWKQYFFHNWAEALVLAEFILPADPGELVREALVEAGLEARQNGSAIRLEPDQDNWWLWLQSIYPYYEAPIIAGAELSSCGLLLAAAAQFPAWMTQADLVKFWWEEAGMDPLVRRMRNINLMLYGLNGYTLQQLDVVADIQRHIQAREQRVLWPERDAPAYLYHTRVVGNPAQEAELPLPAREEVGPGTFADLFKGG